MVYVSSDWHGVPVERIEQLLKKVNFSSDDYLFVLGDVIDRGKHGVELIKRIMFEPNIALIRGNHEQMLLQCDFLFREITEDSINDINARQMRCLRIWQSNGADPTIEALSKEPAARRKMILEYLEDTPLYDTVRAGGRDYLLVHAGLGAARKGRLNNPLECDEEDLLWTRPQITTQYSSEFTTVFGHTPTCFYGDRYKGKILKNRTWIDVDTGAAMGGNPALLRLDDLQEFYLNE